MSSRRRVNGSWVAEGGAAWWIANLTDSAGRWCVPVSVMVSGALLLDPRRAEPPREFYRRRLVRIGVPLVAWTLVYLAYRRWWLDEPLTAGEAGRDVLAGTPFLQLYFLYVLVGLYLLTPYLRILIRHTTRRIQVAFAGTLLALGLVDQVAEMLVGSGTANVATGFLPFAGYFVAGWVLRDVATPRLARPSRRPDLRGLRRRHRRSRGRLHRNRRMGRHGQIPVRLLRTVGRDHVRGGVRAVQVGPGRRAIAGRRR
jgi:hypothetical protein